MNIQDFNYHLPEGRIALFPVSPRDESKLMIMDRNNGSVRDSKYSSIVDLLKKGDVLVINDTSYNLLYKDIS